MFLLPFFDIRWTQFDEHKFQVGGNHHINISHLLLIKLGSYEHIPYLCSDWGSILQEWKKTMKTNTEVSLPPPAKLRWQKKRSPNYSWEMHLHSWFVVSSVIPSFFFAGVGVDSLRVNGFHPQLRRSGSLVICWGDFNFRCYMKNYLNSFKGMLELVKYELFDHCKRNNLVLVNFSGIVGIAIVLKGWLRCPWESNSLQ